ncbi:succinate dehydrogenase, hydrophobic membrane anchor protein [Glacieibacterium megasporae]|uniref:succinate dehydrogenase, hydrophobic membrane anchor protein n=1 Tax=Glacieibacterium megasporae TaxID=2835787 RepID=UPI001CAA7A30|nr:succinate dehydrogenase, hydrophobic membrane anchor protein [Polymorphobacter megasporae]UAJ11005.1 succinate dehydrogenase, hydrophobic membrane anchor protein [Polymorphobacter megasporae]
MRDDSRRRRVAGLGSAGTGLAEWRLQRLTALALIPLGLYFVASVLHMAAAPHDIAAGWLTRPFNAFVMLLFVVAMLLHALVGLRSIMADYVHGRMDRFLAEIGLLALALALGLAGVLAILKVFTGGGGS